MRDVPINLILVVLVGDTGVRKRYAVMRGVTVHLVKVVCTYETWGHSKMLHL